jgi:glycosyltransferase involved in cell wall biosynthesis
MKVLHISLSYKSAPSLGGPDTTVYKLCTALRRLGVTVDVVCTNLATKTEMIQPNSFERNVEGVQVNHLKTKKLFPLGKHSFGLFYMPELRPLLRATIRNYDILHCNGYRDYLTLVACQEAHAAGVPYINHPRGTLPYHSHSFIAKTAYDRLLGRRILRRSSGCIALSNREVDSFLKLDVDPDLIRVINNGIDTADYDPRTSGDAFRERHGIKERFVVLYLGRVHMIKGIDHVIRAVARLSRAGFDVAAVVVGPEEGYGKTLLHVAEAENFQHLYMLPVVSGIEKRQALGAADALVYAAEVEAFGVVAFEGIVSGVPTIVASGSGCGEIVSRLNAGYVVSYGRVDELSDTLRGILDSPDVARDFTLRARPAVISALDWSNIAAQILNFYEAILHG